MPYFNKIVVRLQFFKLNRINKMLGLDPKLQIRLPTYLLAKNPDPWKKL